jgi:aryl-alcohol dehydrogenase-like predicted oxidoreductase
METLNAQVKAGKIRYFACSNWRLDRIVAAQNYALQHGFTGFVGNQMMWSYAEVDTHAMPDKTMVAMDDALRSYHEDTGLAAIPYSSQAQGWFQRMATNTLGQMNPTTADMFNGVINELRFARLTHLATESGLSLTDLILGYLQSQPFPTLPIIGCRTPDQLRDSMHAGDIRLSRDQMAFLEQDSIASRANSKAGNRNI